MPTETISRAVGLAVDGLSKQFTGGHAAAVTAFQDVSFELAPRQFLAVLGPSGCGKTTLLHVVSGLEPESSGSVTMGDRIIAAPDRYLHVGYMFQKDLLLPWAKVIDNVALGLVVTGRPRDEARERAMRLLDRYGLGRFADRYPAQLSGGMRQRAAVIRTLLVDRDILLLDEPFSALDAFTRRQMQDWLLSLWAELRQTVMFVTHDIDEAILLADRVIVMTPQPGRVHSDTIIDLPRPRGADVIASHEFGQYKRQFLTAFSQL